METSRSERFGALAGLVASLAVGVPFAVDAVQTGGELVVGPAWLWWACYLGYLAVFLWDSQLGLPVWLHHRVLIPIQAVLGVAVYLLSAGFGWVPVLFVVTAVSAAYELSRPATVTIVTAQTLLVGAGVALEQGPPVSDALLGVIVYGSFQAFAVMMVWAKQRETAARARADEAHERLELAHAQLQAAAAVLETSSRNAERLRIARELHDLVGHQLTALALQLEVAAHSPPSATDVHVTQAQTIAQDLLDDVRSVVGQLRAPQHDLRDVLARITAGFPRPRIHLDIDDDLELTDDTAPTLARCIQEIVTNAARHSDADTLRIELSMHHGAVTLRANDDGRGVESLKLGNGLTGLRERIEALDGTVRFRSEPGNGLQVHAQIPAR